MKRLLTIGAIVAGSLVGMGTAHNASALERCTVTGVGTNTARVRCLDDSADYRAAGTCVIGGVSTEVKGPWRTINQTSTIYCIGGTFASVRTETR